MKKMKKVLFIFGTRPEAIKLAPIIDNLRAKNIKLQFRICVTAQHREMLDQFLKLFEIEPDYDLDIMIENQSLFNVTLDGLKKLEKVLNKEKPDIILVQGDTSTTFIASLAAYYLKIKIGHIEAGLRTQDKFNPFPEEINRRFTDCLADLCFAPTEQAMQNLLKEGVDREKIFVTGNTVIDALLMTNVKLKSERTQQIYVKRFQNRYNISFDNRKIILVTGHRRESFGKNFENICYALKQIAENNPQVQIIYPVHLNPNVQQPVKNILERVKGIHLIEPLDYTSFVFLMSQAYIILTDSGGIQEEAPSMGKPVLLMRETTERPEGVKAGTAKLVGTDRKRIFSETTKLLDDVNIYQTMAKAINPYGDGQAADRIVDVLIKKL